MTYAKASREKYFQFIFSRFISVSFLLLSPDLFRSNYFLISKDQAGCFGT